MVKSKQKTPVAKPPVPNDFETTQATGYMTAQGEQPYLATSPNSVQDDMPYVANGIQQGDIYVWSNGIYNTKNWIDADKLYETLNNNYIKERIDKLTRLIFTEKFELEVVDAAGDPDDDLAKQMMLMCEEPKVNLWSKMMIAWKDIFSWGPALFNPIWEKAGNEWRMTKLRHLPPESFGRAWQASPNRYSDILQGIVINQITGDIEFYQRPKYWGMPVRIHNVFMLKDPTCPQVAGESKVLPIVPLLSMLDFAWRAQMQQLNRIGAPSIFIKVTKPIINTTRNDIAWANQILANWGNNSAFQLRENMTIVSLDPKETQTGIVTIRELQQRVEDYFQPSSFIAQKKGSSIGSGGDAHKDMFDDWTKGNHSFIEEGFAPLLNQYLVLNGYDGYTVRINIPMGTADRSALDLQQATAAFQCKVATVNELRSKLDLPELDDQGLADLDAHYAPPPMNPALQMPPMPQIAPLPGGIMPTPPPEEAQANMTKEISKQADPVEDDLVAAYDELQKKVYNVLRKKA